MRKVCWWRRDCGCWRAPRSPRVRARPTRGSSRPRAWMRSSPPGGTRVQSGHHRQRHRPAGADAAGAGPTGVGGYRRRRRPSGRAGDGGADDGDPPGVCADLQGVPPVPAGTQGCRRRGRVGVRLVCPVDEFNASRHVGDDSPAELPSPSRPRSGSPSSSSS